MIGDAQVPDANGTPPPPRGAFNMTARALLMILLGAVIVLLLDEGFRRALPHAGGLMRGALTVFAGLPVLFFAARRVIHRGIRDTIVAVSDGLLSLAERDYSIRLALERKDEVGMLVYRFNRLAELLRRERNDLYQKEMLPETILASTSMIVVLFNEAGRIVYSNSAARDFYAQGKLIDGQDFRELIRKGPAELAAAAEAPDDILFTCSRAGTDEPDTFHLSKRYFEFSMQKHTLVVLRPLTQELARKEVETWKKAIRVLSHEMNNSLAPITSLLHSARLMLDNPAHAQRLRDALDTIDERALHLRTFLDGYASFARLPLPNRRAVPWKDLLAGVEGLYSFRVEGALPARPAFVDPAQLQQVLINLLKNAAESGSPLDAITIEFQAETRDGVELRVLDRGKGMAADVLKNALVPFYSTKMTGTGLGLPLCREIVDAHGGRLSLHPRPDGGMAVRCWLPGGDVKPTTR
jgi:two-component system, NtrC family, nitrogen regulation sensor histidine kinase NtrY